MYTNSSNFIPPPPKTMDFIAVAGGPTATAAGEIVDYENRLKELQDMHSPMSLYEMETMENPHTIQRQIMHRLFPTTHREAAVTSKGGEGQVQLFRRMTDGLVSSFGIQSQPADPVKPAESRGTYVQAQVNFVRRMSEGLASSLGIEQQPPVQPSKLGEPRGNYVQPQVNFVRRMTESVKEAFMGSGK